MKEDDVDWLRPPYGAAGEGVSPYDSATRDLMPQALRSETDNEEAVPITWTAGGLGNGKKLEEPR
jgi:hypothetical protein